MTGSQRDELIRRLIEADPVKRLLAGLRGQAEALGKDDIGRAQIVRTVTKQIVVHRASDRSRLTVT